MTAEFPPSPDPAAAVPRRRARSCSSGARLGNATPSRCCRCGAIGGACLVAVDALLHALPRCWRRPASLIGRFFEAPWIDGRRSARSIAGLPHGPPVGACCAWSSPFIGFLIHVYSTGYMEHDERLHALLRLPEPVLRLDAGAGAGRPPAGDVRRLGGRRPLLATCSSASGTTRTPTRCAGKKAFIVNRIGDFGFLLGDVPALPVRPARSSTPSIAAARSRAAR